MEQVAPTARVSSAGHGRGVGLVDGDVDGPFEGVLEGDRVGCDDRCDKREEKRHIMCCHELMINKKRLISFRRERTQ